MCETSKLKVLHVYTNLIFHFSRNIGELLSEDVITTIHRKLKRSKEERITASKVRVSI